VMKTRLKDRWIWITGASSGIGESLAIELMQDNRLILSARNAEKLRTIQQKSPENIWILPVDVTDEEQTQNLQSALGEITSQLDTIILNAGDCEYIDLPEFDAEKIQRMSDVNYVGTARCISASLPLLRKSRKQPHIVGVSSASVFFGLPRAEAYGSSKVALEYLLQSLRVDLFRYGVDVSIVYPGFVDTPLTEKNDFPMPFIIDSRSAAKRIVKGIKKRKHSISFPWALIASLKFLRLLPTSLSTRFCQRLVRN